MPVWLLLLATACLSACNSQKEPQAKTTAALGETLNDASISKEARAAVLRELAQRGEAAAIPYIDTYLATEREADLFIMALGALVATGREEAAHVIIEHTKKKSPDMVVQMIYALEQLPGAESEAFLMTMAHGYPDNKVRETAKNVLKNKKRFAPTSGEN